MGKTDAGKLLVHSVRFLPLLLFPLGGCAMDPVGLAISAASPLHSANEPVDIVPELKDSYRSYDCEQLARLDDVLRPSLNVPDGPAVAEPLEAIRQLRQEKACPRISQTGPAATSLPPASVSAGAAAGTGTPPTAPGAATAAPERGRLGVSVFAADNLPMPVARDLGITDGHGVLITGTAANGAAAVAGIKAVDVVRSIDGQPLVQANQLISYLASRKAGEAVRLEIWRNRSSVFLTATLQAAEAAPPGADGGSGIYCYAKAFPQTPARGGSIYWKSTPFALPGATQNNAAAQGKVVGQQFQQYLIGQGLPVDTVEAAFGICGNGLEAISAALKADEDSSKTSAFTSTGSASVTIAWAP
jgi:hypothetical protein